MKVNKKKLKLIIKRYLINESVAVRDIDDDLKNRETFLKYVDDDGENISDVIVAEIKSLIPEINKMIKKAKNSIKSVALKIAKERRIIRPGIAGLYDSFVVSQNIDKMPNPKIIVKKTIDRNIASSNKNFIYAYYTISKPRYLIYNLPEIKNELKNIEVKSIQDVEDLIEKNVTDYTTSSGNEFNSITLSAFMLFHKFSGGLYPLPENFKEKIINSTIIKEEIAHFVDYAVEDLLQSLTREKNKEKIYEISEDLKIRSQYNTNTFSRSYLKNIDVDQIIDPRYKSEKPEVKLMLYYQKYHNQLINDNIKYFKEIIKEDPVSSQYNISQFDNIKNKINKYINVKTGSDELYASLSSIKNLYGKNLQEFLDISPHMLESDPTKFKILAMRLMLTEDLDKLEDFMKKFKSIKYA